MKPWTERFLDLEALLAKPDPRPDISAYHDMPYAIFHYPPSEELAFRREMNLLATRLRNQAAKRVSVLSLAELLDKAVGSVMSWPELISDERTIGLPEVQDTLHQILSEEAPLPDLVATEMPQDPDPERDVVFLWRTGSLFPFYRTFALLEQLKGKVVAPTILCYPGSLDGPAGLRFMGQLEAEHNYRPKIF